MAPPSLKVIGDAAFCDCEQLKTVKLQEGLQVMGNNCFSGAGFDEIVFPTTLQKIGYYAANEEKEITVHISSGTEIDYVSPSITLVLRNDIAVCGGTLSDLRTRKVIELPEGLEAVGSCWFSNCQVEKVVVPTSVKEIGNNAFRACKRLKEVVF